MIILEIFLALWWIWLPGLVIWYLVHRSNNKAGGSSSSNAQRDQMWLTYLQSFRGRLKTKQEDHLIETLIEGRPVEELYGAAEHITAAHSAGAAVFGTGSAELAASDHINGQAMSYNQAALAAGKPEDQVLEVFKPAKKSEPIDNTILLLYFGAFLLVASVGLFVAIGGLDSLARTIIVALTSAVLYFGGLWLYGASKKMEQAGISFMGTGLIIAPLTGVAWYNLVSHQESGGIIWSLTSVVCLSLYIHAFSRVKNDFISYLLIGSFVSVIESAVLSFELPSYGYAWGLIIAGITLQVVSRLRAQAPELNRAGDVSAQLLVPLSIVGSLALLPDFGSIQFAVTLFLAGSYYTMLAWLKPAERGQYSAAAQATFISAIASTVYFVQEDFLSVGVTLVAITGLYALVISLIKKEITFSHNLVGIASAVAVVSFVLTLEEEWPFVASLSVATTLCAVIWLKLRYITALQIGGLILVILPFIAGQNAMEVSLGSGAQLALCVASFAILGIVVTVSSQFNNYKQYYMTASALFLFAATLLIVPAWANSFAVLCATSSAVAAAFIGLKFVAADSNWLICSGLAATVPIAYSITEFGTDDGRFSATVAAALIFNLGISLVTRQSLVRWIVVACMLLAPFALGGGGLGFKWQEAGFAGGYMLAMASCLLSRTIARGKLLLSSKVPISSYYAEASQAYVAGYTMAGAIALLVSLFDSNSQIVTSLVLAGLVASVIAVARVEKDGRVLMLLPILAQGLLFSALRPDTDDTLATATVAVLSSIIAVVCYLSVQLASSNNGAVERSIRLASLFTAYVGPMLAITQEKSSLLFPLSLLIAGLLTSYHNRTAFQGYKELSAGVSIASVNWFIYLAGVHNIHAHTHIIAFFLACFALWRSSIKDEHGSNLYVQALFFVVTVPLALQALGDESGASYGLILIAEQVAFMVAGAMFSQKFLLRWGLWTALAAVLFQLRGLGWAFLSLLAIIVIGVAVYRLQKHEPPK